MNLSGVIFLSFRCSALVTQVGVMLVHHWQGLQETSEPHQTRCFQAWCCGHRQQCNHILFHYSDECDMVRTDYTIVDVVAMDQPHREGTGQSHGLILLINPLKHIRCCHSPLHHL